MNFKLSPSDLTYLYNGCKFCFWLKVKLGISQPSMPMPGIFSAIAARQKEFYAGKATKDFCKDLPPGTVLYGEQPVHSKAIQFDGLKNECHIRGRFDVVIKFDDGSYGVIDCKTASPSDEKAQMYGRQLQAYAFALEHPEAGALMLAPVSTLGLIFFTPSSFEQAGEGRQSFQGKASWVQVPRNDQHFMEFLRDVVSVLEREVPPEPASDCQWCQYRVRMKNMNFMGAEKTQGRSLPAEQNAASHPSDSPLCPRCNGLMNLKKGKFGEFWSCQKFPDCRGTKNLSPSTAF